MMMKLIKGVALAVLLAMPVVGFADAVTNVTYKSSLALGATYKSGNTEKSLYTVNLIGERYAPKTDWLNSLYGEYGKTDSQQTEGKVRGQSNYRYKLGGEDFFVGVYGEMLTDAIQNIRFRGTLGPDVGYYFINKEKTKLDFSVGLNYVYERTSTEERDYGAWRVAGNYFNKFTDMSEFYLNVSYSGNIKDVADSTGLLVTGVKTKVKDNFSLFVEVRDEYDNEKDAGVEEYNDVTVLAGLAYDFM
jgi:putative salt-induced outer membrane protein YdiY